MVGLGDLHFPCLNIMSAGTAKFKGQYILLIGIETMRGNSVFAAARSSDGFHFVVDKEPIMVPATKGEFQQYEEYGVEDPRITCLDDAYYIVYTAHSRHGFRLALAKTNDFKTIERIALISEPDNKSAALFPKKINGRYVRLERPSAGANIWISYSEDLIYWGCSKVILTTRGGGFWDANRVGCAVPPIEVAQGWLVIYYGENLTPAGPIFRLGAALLDKNAPSVLLGRSDAPILSPREYYERVGDTNNLVFSCGAVVEDNNEVKLYYGAANTVICVGTAKITDLVERCFERKER